MRVLVTGGAGYIGSITAQALLEAGHEVVALDDLSRGHRAIVPAGCTFVEGDVADARAVAGAVAGGIDACIHLAGFIDAAESVAQPAMYMDTNVRKTEVLLDALASAGVDRFVLSSSAAVYGAPKIVPIPVDHPREPANPYGASKAGAEDVIRAHGGFRFAFLRYFNASGATPERGEAHRNESHLIPRVLDVAVGRTESVGINGTDYETRDGTCIRDYVHVADLAVAHVQALDALDVHPEVVCNVGTGYGFTVNEVVEACRSVTGHPIPAVYSPRRPGDVAELVADPSDAKTLLGWEPRFRDVESIVASAWAWHRRLAAGETGLA